MKYSSNIYFPKIIFWLTVAFFSHDLAWKVFKNAGFKRNTFVILLTFCYESVVDIAKSIILHRYQAPSIF